MKHLVKQFLFLMLSLTATRNYMIPHIASLEQVIALFGRSAPQIEQQKNDLLTNVTTQLNALLALQPHDRTFNNLVRAYDDLVAEFQVGTATFATLQMTSPDATIRQAAQQALIALEAFAIDNFSLNKQLYQALQEYAQRNRPQETLTDEEEYYLAELLKGFKNSGLELPEEQQQELKALNKELAVLSVEFDNNVNTDNRTVSVSKKELLGLDEIFIQNLRRDAEGNYVLGIDYPTYFNVMENCEVESTRKALWHAFYHRAFPANQVLLEKIVALRHQIAVLLGYPSYAALDIDEQMAQTPERVQTFLEELVVKSMPKLEQEVAAWTQVLPESVQLTQDGKIKLWDLRFIQDHYKKTHLHVDEKLIQEYFPMEHTIDQLLAVYEKFLAIKFKKITTAPDAWWHPDVMTIGLYNQQDQLLGYLMLDLFPRDNKYNHACQIDIVPAVKTKEGTYYPAAAVVLANFPKPTGETPSLLKHSDVVTFFHEFGHAIHSLLGATQMVGFSGTRVKRDFVEMPSQMLEEWMWDPAIIKQVSSHYQTHEPLPEALIQKMRAAKVFDSGDWVLRQIGLSYMALNYFAPGEQKDLQKIKKDIFARLRPHIAQFDEHFECSFGHLLGYGAKYYGYLWSKVFALDLFAYIKKYGLLNPVIGTRYAQEILGKGGSKRPEELIKNFLGRAPQSDAFFADLGL